MSAQITGLSQAQRNANDGISIAQTAEGALNQVNDNLQRVRELAVQAQNGTNSSDDLQSIQDEINQRLEEVDRISGETNFNGTKVLASEQSISIQVGANDGEAIKVNLKEITAETLKLGDFSVSDKKVEFSEDIARKSDASSSTHVAFADDTSFDASATEYSSTGFAGTDGAAAKAYLETTGVTVTDTGDSTDSGTTADQAVLSVKIDGGDYFVAVDEAGENKINLLKQDGTGGYEKVQVENAAGGTVDVQVAVFNGKVTTFANDGSGNAQRVDLTEGASGAKATELLAKNDDNLVINIDGENHNVYEIEEDGTASGKYGVRMDDGTVYAVSVDDATGNVAIQEDADGNKVQYALKKDGDVASVVEYDGDLYGATLNATFNAAATRDSGKFDTDLLQTTGTAKPLETLDNALNQVDSLRSELGAVQNRFESAITNLSTNETNLSAARSRIEDADYAVEVANMTRAQILQQAGTSVLAQANQIPQSVLSLLG